MSKILQPRDELKKKLINGLNFHYFPHNIFGPNYFYMLKKINQRGELIF